MRSLTLGLCAAFLAAGCAGGDSGSAAAAGTNTTALAAAESTRLQAGADEAARAAGASSPATRGLPPGAIHVERAVIVDATGFEAPMAASTLFLPRGWRTEGGVFWGQQFMCTNGYNFDWFATSPDGAQSIYVLHQERWETNNYNAPPGTPGCPIAPITSVRQYLENHLQRWRPGARPIDFRPRDDAEREFANLNSATPTAMGEMRTWVEAGEVLFAFNDRGTDMRGTIAALVVFSLTRSSAGPGFPVMDALTGFALPAYAATAPSARFDPQFFEAIRRSLKVNPQWEARISGHNAAIGRVALEESRKRAAIIAKSNAEIARIREEAWSAYQESSDRRAREFGELIRGVETYDDPKAAGGQVQLSGHYDQAWRLEDGSYVLTNDPNFEPWRDIGVAGDRLKASR